MLYIFLVILLILLLLVTAFEPEPGKLSLFELKRRSAEGDRDSKQQLKRQLMLNDVVSFQRVVISVLLVIIVLFSIITFDFWLGVIVSVVIAVEYNFVSSLKPVKFISSKLYPSIEKLIIKLIKKAPIFFKLIRSNEVFNKQRLAIGSRAELQQIISDSDNILTFDEKSLIVNGLSIKEVKIDHFLTSRDKIIFIKKSEFLGPLNLNELHKSGHTLLPVVNGDIDHIVGILNLKNLLTLDVKRSTTAEKAMDPKVYYVRNDQTLYDALAVFVSTHSSMLIVINKSCETVGALTLSDISKALLGRVVFNELESSDNPRDVAQYEKA